MIVAVRVSMSLVELGWLAAGLLVVGLVGGVALGVLVGRRR